MNLPRQKTSLGDRLRRLGIVGQTPRVSVDPVSIDTAIPGGEVCNRHGTFLLRKKRFDRTHRHGRLGLGGALDLAPHLPGHAGRLSGYAGVPATRRLYLDTETTSLGSGAGVKVFLIGAGFFTDDGFVVHQYLMRHPGEERAMLLGLRDLLTNFDALVTFHGRSFDCPRMNDRFLFQDLSCDLTLPLHLDLHHAARRLFGHRFEHCRLQVFERELLGFHRADDLPGSACPEAWFEYQRGHSNRLPDVLRHNLDDILSLVVLEQRVGAAFTTPEDAREALAAGVLAFQGHDLTLAHQLLVRAVPSLTEAPGVPLGLRAVAALRHLRLGATARQLLQRLEEAHPADERIPRAWAILEERGFRDPVAALEVVNRALGRLGLDQSDLLKRRERLMRRCGALRR